MLNDEVKSDLPDGLSQPALSALRGAGIYRLEQLAGFRQEAVKNLHGIGPNAMIKLKSALNARGLKFQDPTEGEDEEVIAEKIAGGMKYAKEKRGC